MTVERLKGLDQRYAMRTYARSPVEFVRGEGSRLWDSEGREYIDLFSGLSVHNAGHGHPRIVDALVEQARTFAGSSNLYLSGPGLELCRRLSESSLGGRAFLCNTGTEANECAIKLVRKHAHLRGVERPGIVALEHGFHGRTMGSLAATGKLAREDYFGPLLPGFVGVPRDDPGALRAAVGESTAAVIVETIQGEAGVHPVAEEVLHAARAATEQAGAALIVDEIQTGMGRTGSLWSYEQLGLRPDLITAAKALGGGLPVGACIASPAFSEVLEPGDHGSTFAGAPIAARAALAALEILSEPELLASVDRKGADARAFLDDLAGVVEVRGRGLMIGVTLGDGIDAAAVRDEALARGVVVNAPSERILRLLPPLTIEPSDLERGLDLLAGAIAARAVS